MKERFIEAGEIVNTHGVRGEIKILPWTDSAEFLAAFRTLYIDGKPVRVRSSRVHKGTVLAALEGVEDVNAAMRLKGRRVFIDRADAKLPEGGYFIQDIIGAEVVTRLPRLRRARGARAAHTRGAGVHTQHGRGRGRHHRPAHRGDVEWSLTG